MRSFWLGSIGYSAAHRLQERLYQEVLAGGDEVLLTCEHPPVISLGHRGLLADLLVSQATLQTRGIEVVTTDRGGQATYHGPGQLVFYPIVSVRRHGVLHHVAGLGQAAVAVAQAQGVHAQWQRDPVGVFVADRKLAAIGVRIRRGLSTHGLALNVTVQATAPFRAGLFIACGNQSARVTSLEEEGGRSSDFSHFTSGKPKNPNTVPALAQALTHAFCQTTGRPQVALVAAPTSILADSV